MLTKKQNLRETIHGGNPDRLVNQFEYVSLFFDPATMAAMGTPVRGGAWNNGWGVRIEFPEHVPGMFPNTSPEYVVIKDIENWQKYVHAPKTEFTDEEWAPFLAPLKDIDRNVVFVAPFVAPGIFEKLHYLMGMEDCMMAMYEEPEAMHDLVDFIVEAEVDYAKTIMTKVPEINALLHHDDWGSAKNSFLSPDMFDEFIVPGYKKIYSTWKELGCQLIVHHNDSYTANLVPEMIEMGIDIWQGCFPQNNLPELCKQYAGQITFMGEIESRLIDLPDVTDEQIKAEVDRACRKCKGNNFIPCLTAGVPLSSFPGVMEKVSAEIDVMSKELFGFEGK